LKLLRNAHFMKSPPPFLSRDHSSCSGWTMAGSARRGVWFSDVRFLKCIRIKLCQTNSDAMEGLSVARLRLPAECQSPSQSWASIAALWMVLVDPDQRHAACESPAM
jgi:hypothetical protein